MPSYVADYPEPEVAGAMAQRGLLMQPVRTQIVKFLVRQDQPITVPEIQKAIDVDYHPTLRHVKALVSMGWVRPVLNIEDTTRRYVIEREVVAKHLYEYVHDVLDDAQDPSASIDDGAG